MGYEDKEPEDLEVRIGTKIQAEFDRILRVQNEVIVKSEANLELDKVIRDHCIKRIAEESELLESQKEQEVKETEKE